MISLVIPFQYNEDEVIPPVAGVYRGYEDTAQPVLDLGPVPARTLP